MLGKINLPSRTVGSVITLLALIISVAFFLASFEISEGTADTPGLLKKFNLNFFCAVFMASAFLPVALITSFFVGFLFNSFLSLLYASFTSSLIALFFSTPDVFKRPGLVSNALYTVVQKKH